MLSSLESSDNYYVLLELIYLMATLPTLSRYFKKMLRKQVSHSSGSLDVQYNNYEVTFLGNMLLFQEKFSASIVLNWSSHESVSKVEHVGTISPLREVFLITLKYLLVWKLF